MSHQISFPSVDTFCFNQTDVHFPNEKAQLEFESIKRDHTNMMVEIISEKFWNNRTGISRRLYNTSSNLQDLIVRVAYLMHLYPTDYHNKSLIPILNLMEDDTDFFDTLWDYAFTKLPRQDALKVGIKKEEEMKKLGDLISTCNLNLGTNENQTMVFDHLKIDEIYDRSIVQVSKFTLNRPSKPNNDFKSTSTLYYTIFLPFHDKNYDANSTDCAHYWEIPNFSSEPII